MSKLEVNIPFEGFYDSFYSEGIDREEESFVEWRREEGDINEEQARELHDLLWRHTRYDVAYNLVAQDYIIAFNEKFKEWTDVDLQLEFVTMESPREYNFTTDRLFAKADEEALLALRAKVDEDVLREIIRERFTSRSGFISFYSNSLEAWPSELSEWDHNQLCTLLMCFLPEDWRWDMYYAVFDNGAYRAWEAAVNWPPIEEFLEQCKENHEQV